MFKVLGKLDIRSGSNNMNIAQRAIFDYASRYAYAIAQRTMPAIIVPRFLKKGERVANR